jgi:antitoxin StbD
LAILRNSALVGYFVPADAVSSQQCRAATIDEVMESLVFRRDITQPVLDYLKDK